MTDTKFSYRKIIGVVFLGMFVHMFINNPNVKTYVIKIFNPLLVAFAIAYLLDNLVKALEPKMGRSTGVAISLVIIITLVLIAATIIIPTVVENISNILKLIPEIDNFQFESVEKYIPKGSEAYFADAVTYAKTAVEKILLKVGEFSSKLLEGLLSTAIKFTSSIISIIVSFVIAIYMLLDKKDLLGRIKRVNYAFLDRKTADYLVYITQKSHEIFSNFFVGKAIDSAIIGLLCFVILLMFKIPFAMVIGIVVGITNMIPYFGPIIGAVPAVVITIFSGLDKAAIVGIVIFALQQFDGLVLGPIILGDKVGVRAFWIIVAVTVGGAVAGVLGMLLGVPVLVLIKTLIEEVVHEKLKKKNMENLCMEDIAPVADKKKKKKIFSKS
ncbi:MAG: AI-2E family transporter [Anaeromicrobium sp.]|uniref:AI-2E family transporter n=1 Tax=Anaeromicrobium sp. TaxID=1929132 RepID=UPI0025F94A26|nr:AI-2E family transporter [Anaeromicrobium sp.]MCT4594400.1 AI-2E family transporter [Anaeromicrobium sp.]